MPLSSSLWFSVACIAGVAIAGLTDIGSLHFAASLYPSDRQMCRVLSCRLGFDTLLAEPGAGSTGQVNSILCQAVDHNHKDISANSSKNMPPAMKLQNETPRHSNGALP